MINLLLPTAVFFPIVMGFVPVFVKDTKKVNLAMVIMSVAELGAVRCPCTHSK